MADKRDYYEVLGIEKTATANEIKKAYRKVAKECHPDLHPGDKECEERFKEVNEAYEVLSDENKRKQYDQFGHSAFDPNGGFSQSDPFNGYPFGDIFGDLFGGSRARQKNAPQRGHDLRKNITLDFREALFGSKKKVNLDIEETCNECDGNGCEKGTVPSPCPNCGGSGQTIYTQRTAYGMTQSISMCPNCQGTGQIIKSPCSCCRGVGKIVKNRTIEVDIPAGIDDGQSLIIRGAGHAGSNGGPTGDCFLTMSILPDANFKRNGNDLITYYTISYADAVLGGVVNVMTPYDTINLTIPAGTTHGSSFVINGKGVVNINTSQYGNLIVYINIDVPTNLTEEQKEKLLEFAKSCNMR